MLRITTGLTALAVLMVVALVGCGQVETTERIEPVARGIDQANFDTTYQPCQDFYQYANGNWLKNNPVPEEYGSWSLMHEVYENNNDIQKKIVNDDALQSAPEGSIAQKITDLYRGALDTVAIDAAGLAPLEGDFEKIAAIASIKDLQDVITAYHVEGINMLFDLTAMQDLVNSEQVMLYITQGGLGLPDRDYYTRDGEADITLRGQYVDHVAAMFVLLGDDKASARLQAESILAIETQLAEKSLTNVESRDLANWHKINTIDEANGVTPNLSWGEYLAELGLQELESFSLAPNKFFVEMNKMFEDVSLDDWKNYLRWHLVNISTPYMPMEFDRQDFAFNGVILGGRKEQQDRWKRALTRVNTFLGEGLGKLYVERVFPPESKTKALEMINNLKTALGARLSNLEWMSDETKVKALEKLDAFGQKIGYPDKWRDYSSLKIDKGYHIDNIRRGRAFEMRRNLDKIGKPVDPTEWGMTPQTSNAYYTPLKNEIVFPAGMLQPPYFDGEIDDAVNYGAMGAVMGHEMLHGFDDKGSHFNKDGNMEDWWTDEDRAKFEERTAMLVKQFNDYIAVDDLHVNGELTLGENIADMGGLRVAYDALQLASAGKEDPVIDGLTRDQRFFLSFAQIWRANTTTEALKLRVQSDPHSPRHLRVLGPLSNMDEFAAAFGCEGAGDMMRPAEERIKIW